MKSLINILFILFFCSSFAQLDSLNYQPSVFFTEKYNQYCEFPVFIAEGSITNFTTSSISYTNDKKSIRLGQEPSKNENYSIGTKGVLTTKKGVVFFGNIAITKQYLQDLKWNLSYADVQPNGILPEPNYYAVSKGSKWDNQFYDVSGGFSIPILKKWKIIFSTDYNLKQKFRHEYDPRPSIKQNKLKILGGTSVEIFTKHHLGLSYSYGYSNVVNRIEYSDSSTNIPYYSKKYARWIFGYGTFFLPTSLDTKRVLNFGEIAIGHHFKNNNWKWFNYLKINKRKSNTYKNDNINESDEEVNAIYSQNKYSLQSNLSKNLGNNKTLSINSFIKNNNGINYLVNQNGNNYITNELNISLASSISKIVKGKTNYNIGVSSKFEKNSQNDKLANEFLKNKAITLGVFGEKQIPINDKWSALSFLKFTYNKPLQVDIQNTNENYINNPDKLDFLGQTLKLYYDEVVYNDYNYLQKNKFILDCKINFINQQNHTNQKIFSLFQKYAIINNQLNSVKGVSIIFKY